LYVQVEAETTQLNTLQRHGHAAAAKNGVDDDDEIDNIPPPSPMLAVTIRTQPSADALTTGASQQLVLELTTNTSPPPLVRAIATCASPLPLVETIITRLSSPPNSVVVASTPLVSPTGRNDTHQVTFASPVVNVRLFTLSRIQTLRYTGCSVCDAVKYIDVDYAVRIGQSSEQSAASHR
jgi:hypothetical protein